MYAWKDEHEKNKQHLSFVVVIPRYALENFLKLDQQLSGLEVGKFDTDWQEAVCYLYDLGYDLTFLYFESLVYKNGDRCSGGALL